VEVAYEPVVNSCGRNVERHVRVVGAFNLELRQRADHPPDCEGVSSTTITFAIIES
jgi:hypothetical protein